MSLNNADRLTSRILPNGITTTYGYDNMSRLKQLKDQSPTATLFDRQYGYNNASQINQIAEPSQVRNFGYDNVDRLTSMTSPTVPNENYTFDDVGNRLTSHRSANYVYDANGNIRQKAEGKELWRYGWDFENRMVSASTRRQTVRYKYDALGRRIQRYKVGGEENTKFIYDGYDILVDDNKGTLTKYLNGQGIDDKLRVQTGNDVKYFISDHLGSTNALTDISGNVTSSASYDSFGNATGNLATRYQFTGREFDSFTGLHFYRARWYDGNLGRFISEDPIGFAGGDVNLFGYVRNNPLNFVDPLGEEATAFYFRSNGTLIVIDINAGKNRDDYLIRINSDSYENLFSGNEECKNKNTCDAEKDKGPIPPGYYLIGTEGYPDWLNGQPGYPLYRSQNEISPSDGPFKLGYAPVTDPFTGKKADRGGYYIHSGLTSLGCITFPAEQQRNEPNYPSNRNFSKLDDTLRKTTRFDYKGGQFTGRLVVLP